MPTHAKGHDKDKYYFLAKDQGFRARSAFKLIQINKRFDILTKARVCLDLCAAPGSWCQVAAKEMPQGSLVIGVDLLPIRAIKGVTTIVSDITTAECRRKVADLLTGWKCDVVLCDGAPNIGANYQKDAFVQNELVLAALKTATDHLSKGGSFVTKVYRSVDYESLIWVFQQMFEDVQAIKPNSSRSQSSEIFVVCLKYMKPDKLDPKLLDPNHVFKSVDNKGMQGVDVMHKKYDKLNKRNRQGYDEVIGDVLLVKKGIVSDFINGEEPLRVLTDVNELDFSEACEEFRESAFTTPEILECLKDLRILGKGDFKKMLKWRTKIRDLRKAETAEAEGPKVSKKDEEAEKEETEEDILDQIMEDRAEAMRQEQKRKKKIRERSSKDRSRQALGITNESFGVEEDQDLFRFSEVNDKVSSKNFKKLMDSATGADDDDSDADSLADNGGLIFKKDTLEDELEDDFKRYSKYKVAIEKKSRRGKEYKESDFIGYDSDDEVTGKAATDEDDDSSGALSGSEGDDGSDAASESEESEFEMMPDSDEEVDQYLQPVKKRKTVGEKTKNTKKRGAADSNDESMSEDDEEEEEEAGRADKWFSHPIFKEEFVGADIDAAEKKAKKASKLTLKGKGKSKTSAEAGSDEEEDGKKKAATREVEKMIADMPKTDKQLRAEKRKKDQERKLRRADKKERATKGEEVGAWSSKFDIAAGDASSSDSEGGGPDKIKVVDDDKGFEVAPSDYTGGIDSGSDSSEDSGYDSEEKARTLAMGTLALRGTNKRKMIDDSHNRYSWGDSKDLPDWFNMDEKKHMKRMVSLPMGLVKSTKKQGATSGGRDIKKVAEAKMRKKKRAANALQTAKKKATALAENSEMSDKQKLRAISKAMKNSKVEKPGKVYVVSSGIGKQNTAGRSGNGKLKFVDKRMRSDNKRGSKKQREKAKKGGKRGR
jgi:AdoMet-dependent rRNA methyltransferase SPB1